MKNVWMKLSSNEKIITFKYKNIYTHTHTYIQFRFHCKAESIGICTCQWEAEQAFKWGGLMINSANVMNVRMMLCASLHGISKRVIFNLFLLWLHRQINCWTTVDERSLHVFKILFIILHVWKLLTDYLVKHNKGRDQVASRSTSNPRQSCRKVHECVF